MKSHGVTIQMKATEQYFPVVLLIKLQKGLKTKPSFKSSGFLSPGTKQTVRNKERSY